MLIGRMIRIIEKASGSYARSDKRPCLKNPAKSLMASARFAKTFVAKISVCWLQLLIRADFGSVLNVSLRTQMDGASIMAFTTGQTLRTVGLLVSINWLHTTGLVVHASRQHVCFP